MATPKKVKISAYLRDKATHRRVKQEAKAAGVSLVDYVSDSVEQRLKNVDRKRVKRTA